MVSHRLRTRHTVRLSFGTVRSTASEKGKDSRFLIEFGFKPCGGAMQLPPARQA